jgi:hypothetical protein
MPTTLTIVYAAPYSGKDTIAQQIRDKGLTVYNEEIEWWKLPEEQRNAARLAALYSSYNNEAVLITDHIEAHREIDAYFRDIKIVTYVLLNPKDPKPSPELLPATAKRIDDWKRQYQVVLKSLNRYLVAEWNDQIADMCYAHQDMLNPVYSRIFVMGHSGSGKNYLLDQLGPKMPDFHMVDLDQFGGRPHRGISINDGWFIPPRVCAGLSQMAHQRGFGLVIAGMCNNYVELMLRAKHELYYTIALLPPYEILVRNRIKRGRTFECAGDAEWYEQFKKEMMAIAHSMVTSTDEAEELVQQTINQLVATKDGGKATVRNTKTPVVRTHRAVDVKYGITYDWQNEETRGVKTFTGDAKKYGWPRSQPFTRDDFFSGPFTADLNNLDDALKHLLVHIEPEFNIEQSAISSYLNASTGEVRTYIQLAPGAIIVAKMGDAKGSGLRTIKLIPSIKAHLKTVNTKTLIPPVIPVNLVERVRQDINNIELFRSSFYE